MDEPSQRSRLHDEMPDWRKETERRLPLMGHRNWIVVADSAYPWQTSPGIDTFYTGRDQIEVANWLVPVVKAARHVRPRVYLDDELEHVSEKNAPGIAGYRKALDSLLHGLSVERLPRETIIARLDQAGAAFQILVLKTTMTAPYTSLFMEMDCGYWTDAAERELRRAMGGGRPVEREERV
jgi:hypothetical protein